MMPAMSQIEQAQRPISGNCFVTKLTVGGFKTIQDEQAIDIRPLTLLAGKNNAGKSSIVQPLLLLKQSLESPFEPPGGLLLNGPNVRFTSSKQLLSRSASTTSESFTVKIHNNHSNSTMFKFKSSEHDFLRISQQINEVFNLNPDSTSSEIYSQAIRGLKENSDDTIVKIANKLADMHAMLPAMNVIQQRFFLEINSNNRMSKQFRSTVRDLARLADLDTKSISEYIIDKLLDNSTFLTNVLQGYIDGYMEREHEDLSAILGGLIHLPGLRGTPERSYPLANTGEQFPGTFEKYMASVIFNWQERGNKNAFSALAEDLIQLDLAHHVEARLRDSTAVEVAVKPGRSSPEVISVADVGLGVSQCLPVLVALHVARPDQLVYLEQPEIHLHPRAQVDLAVVLVRAVKRGVRMIVETHSDDLLLGLQTAVTRGDLTPNDIKLHWFTRDIEAGTTRIQSADVDETGGFGSWPEDFSDVDMESRAAYLDAVSMRRRKKPPASA